MAKIELLKLTNMPILSEIHRWRFEGGFDMDGVQLSGNHAFLWRIFLEGLIHVGVSHVVNIEMITLSSFD
jgi:hypothetical protein